jgi:beta-glucuronidase
MIKLFYILIIYLILIKIYAQEVPLLGNAFNRKKISLNGKWNYIIDVQEEGYYGYRMEERKRGFFCNDKPKNPWDLVEYDFDKSPEMEIPSDWNTKDNKLFLYEGTIWFKKSFNYTINPQKKLILYFGAVNYESIIYINGILIGKHIGGFTPFNFDITTKLKNGENFIILKIDNKRKKENIPSLMFDWWNYGGITRDVYLIETDNIYIQNYHFLLNKQNKNQIDIKIELNKNNTNTSAQIIKLSIPELNIRKSLRINNNKEITKKIEVNDLILWTPDNPKLYKIIIKFNDEEIIDHIGFRTIEVLDKKILLNGNPIFLRGISIQDEKPNNDGEINTLKDVKILLSWVKELGCNFIRLVHYPHNEYMIREAEKEGILVWSELPIYWDLAWEDKDTYNNAQRQLNDMILRDINRANVIIWSIGNETPSSKSRDFFLFNLITFAKTLDNSRLITMAFKAIYSNNNIYKNNLNDAMVKYLDIISFNQLLEQNSDINSFDKMKFDISYNKPIIISGLGVEAKFGYHGTLSQIWTEEFQDNYYNNYFEFLETIEGLVGVSPYMLKDFRSPKGVLNSIHNFYNRKGLVSDKGEKKKAFYTLRNWYLTKKKLK